MFHGPKIRRIGDHGSPLCMPMGCFCRGHAHDFGVGGRIRFRRDNWPRLLTTPCALSC